MGMAERQGDQFPVSIAHMNPFRNILGKRNIIRMSQFHTL